MQVTALDTIDSLASNLTSYLGKDQVNSVRRAYYYAQQAHEGQFRRSGDPYVTHPLAVASILSEMHMDHQSLMAAMLHDVIEDTGIEKSAIGTQFGTSVAELVDGGQQAHPDGVRVSGGETGGELPEDGPGDGTGHPGHTG